MTDKEIKLELAKAALAHDCSLDLTIMFYDWVVDNTSKSDKSKMEIMYFLRKAGASVRLQNNIYVHFLGMVPTNEAEEKWCNSDRTIGDFISIFTQEDFLEYNSIGRKSLSEMLDILEEADLQWQ